MGTERSTRVRLAGGARVGTAEHLLAAMAGRGHLEGVRVAIDGDELPVLDGAAGAWIEALDELGASPRRAPAGAWRWRALVVREPDGGGLELVPGEAVRVEVHVDFGRPWLVASAVWDGDPADFARRAAPARTFAREEDLAELAARGLARHVDPSAVVVLGAHAALAQGAPFAPDEPARHKLLDLLGDLVPHGGPFRGTVRVWLPGHARTHRLFARADVRAALGLAGG